jgi:transposase InsO family protein
MIDSLQSRFPSLAQRDIYAACNHSRSQLYIWRQADKLDRKTRDPKALDEGVIENAAMVISNYPHFGGVKGQAFMLYHGLGFIGQKAYSRIKGNIKRVLIQEVSQRKDLPANAGSYEHIRAEGVGEIWAEDFTEVVFNGLKFKLALLIDVYSQYILGWALARRATESLVATPVHQALAANGGVPPKKFLLQDNGKQYVSENHQGLLSSLEIVSRHVPAYTPQYNGAIECGGKEFKNVFYNVIEQQDRNETDKEKKFDDRMQQAAIESVRRLNEVIPRPALNGVTPDDVQTGRKPFRQEEIKRYRQEQEAKGAPPPLSRPFWDVLKDGVRAEVMSTKELLTKLAFFRMRPLRQIARLNREVWGN